MMAAIVLAASTSAAPPPPPPILGQLPLDCPCFFTTHLFVPRANGRQIDKHFHLPEALSGLPMEDARQAAVALADDPAALQALVEAQLPEATESETADVVQSLSAELIRRAGLDAEIARRRPQCRLAYPTSRDPGAYVFDIDGLTDECRHLLEHLHECRDVVGVLAMRTPSGRRIVRAVAPGGAGPAGRQIYELPLFTPEYCSRLASELSAWSSACSDVKSRPNSMNRNGVLLDEAGFTSRFSNALLADVLRPLASLLFPDAGGGTLDHHRVFTAAYDAREGPGGRFDVALATHYDNSEVTCNVNIDGEWEAGELGLFGIDGQARKVYWGHRRGVAIIHLGAEHHAAMPIDAGFRTNLIVWCRSTEARTRRGCPLCGSTERLCFSGVD